MNKKRIKYEVGDKINLIEGTYWPFSKIAVILKKDPIFNANNKRIMGYWYIIKHDPDEFEHCEVHIIPSSYIEDLVTSWSGSELHLKSKPSS